MIDRAVSKPETDASPCGRPAALMAVFGVASAVAAASLLWLSQGSDVFISQAFAAFLACF